MREVEGESRLQLFLTSCCMARAGNTALQLLAQLCQDVAEAGTRIASGGCCFELVEEANSLHHLHMLAQGSCLVSCGTSLAS